LATILKRARPKNVVNARLRLPNKGRNLQESACSNGQSQRDDSETRKKFYG